MKSLRSLEGAYGSNLGPIYTCFFKTWTLMEVALKNVKLLPFLASTPLLTLSIQLHLSVPRFPLFYFFTNHLLHFPYKSVNLSQSLGSATSCVLAFNFKVVSF